MSFICENCTFQSLTMQVVAGTWLYTATKSKISGIWVHLVFFLAYWSSTEVSIWHCVYRIMRKTILNTAVWIAKWGTWNSCCLCQLNPASLGDVWPEHLQSCHICCFCCRTPIRDAHLTNSSFLLCFDIIPCLAPFLTQCTLQKVPFIQNYFLTDFCCQHPNNSEARVHFYTVAFYKLLNNAQIEQHWHQDTW